MSFISEISETLQLVLSKDCTLKDGTWICPKESEGEVLVILSKVEKHLFSPDAKRILETELFENVNKISSTFEKSMGLENLQKMVTILMTFIAFENDFIGHSTRRILLALSEILPAKSSALPSLLHILWNISKIWLMDSLQYASIDVKSNTRSDAYAESHQQSRLPVLHDSDYVFSMLISGQMFFPILKRNWSASTRVILLLQRILKIYKEKRSSRLDIFLNVLKYHIRSIVCAFMFHVFPLESAQNFSKDVIGVTSFPATISSIASNQISQKELLAGSWLQFLCSMLHALIQQIDSMKDQSSLFSLLKDVNFFLPAAAAFSLAPHNHLVFDSCISAFLRHKCLMMILRLSRWFTEYPSLAIVCLESLQAYASDLLQITLSEDRLQPEHNLLDSPFASTLAQTNVLNQPPHSLSISHLKRYAVFLVFKAVISLRKAADNSKRSGPTTSGRILSGVKEAATVAEKCVDFEKWLVSWLLMQIQSSHTSSCTQSQQANRISLSLLYLFVNEDDLMLHLLLELFDLSVLPAFAIDSGSSEPQSLLIAALKPLRLFAAFLSVVQYDHTVIVDYLIANDTGALCLQYLLICLQIMCSTWPEFLQMSGIGCCQPLRKRSSSLHSVTEACSLCVKKAKKVSIQQESCINQCDKSCLDMQGIGGCRNMSSGDPVDAFFVGTKHEAASEGSMVKMDNGTLFNVKKCAESLVALKIGIERMQQKHLFPYNASPLLKHLHIFQQLWQRQMRHA